MADGMVNFAMKIFTDLNKGFMHNFGKPLMIAALISNKLSTGFARYIDARNVGQDERQ